MVAVVLGGSRARGDADALSDVDLGLHYDAERPFDLAALRELARELDERHPADAVTAPGGWGPWIDGGGWLVIDGVRVDWLYRDITRVGRVIDDCTAGRVTAHYQPAALIAGLWEAGFALETAAKPAARGDIYHVAGCLFRCAAVLVQALFALDRRYFMNEKGSIEIAGGLPLCPPGFAREVTEVLAAPGATRDALAAGVARMGLLVEATCALCAAAPG